MMNSHQLINQSSGDVEYYTPPSIIEAARRTMTAIDLDVCSSDAANMTVRAARFFTAADNPLDNLWSGRVWMNHPFLRGENYKWIDKPVAESKLPHFWSACCICFASTSEKWFRPLLAQPQCYLHGRTNYLLPDGTVKKGVTKGSVVTYFGKDVARFAKEFSPLGTIKVEYSLTKSPN